MPKSIGTVEVLVGNRPELPKKVEVPVYSTSTHLALTAAVRNGAPYTKMFNITHTGTGLTIGLPFHRFAIAEQLFKDILAQVPESDMQDRNWVKKASWSVTMDLYAAAQQQDRDSQPKPKKLRERPKTRRLTNENRMTDRWWQLLPFDVPRWLRIYDNDGETVDRYTVVFSGLKDGKEHAAKGRGEHPYVTMSAHPFHPQGVYSRQSSMYKPTDDPFTPGWRTRHGKRICFADLPLDCQYAVLQDYCYYWHLEFDDHPMTKRVDDCSFGISWHRDEKPWYPMRPLDDNADGDARSMMRATREHEMLSAQHIQDLLLLVVSHCPSQDTIERWDWSERRDVVVWATRLHLAASDNIMKVPDKPRVLQDWEEANVEEQS